MKTIIPNDYQDKLSVYDTQRAIGILKRKFEDSLAWYLHLKRVSAPLFVSTGSGLNDDLNGIERSVKFDIKACNNNNNNQHHQAEIVHSLAKWKRLALWQYKFYPGNGLYTDMNAIRRDEELDNIHSIYVDQWDWEKVITESDRNIEYLKQTVRNICLAIDETNHYLQAKFPTLNYQFEKDVFFIDTFELEKMYPNNTPKEREYLICKEHQTVFLMKIGCNLSNGKPHDGRAPDYDDWDLNGDLLVYNPLLDIPFELSSMGIRVNKESLLKQLEIRNCLERKDLYFHSKSKIILTN